MTLNALSYYVYDHVLFKLMICSMPYLCAVAPYFLNQLYNILYTYIHIYIVILLDIPVLQQARRVRLCGWVTQWFHSGLGT